MELTIKAEEKSVNLFYLKDILMKQNVHISEKLDAIAKMRK